VIRLTDAGYQTFLGAIQDKADKIHLMADTGELEGHGYAPKRFDPTKWMNGEYPKLVWEFSSGDPVNVVGYFVTSATGDVLFAEDFPDGAQEIKNTGDRIGVTIKLSLISGA
jgi:hypothetical protein